MTRTSHSLGPSLNHLGTLFVPFTSFDVDGSGLVSDCALVGALGDSSYEGGFGRSSAKAKTEGSRGAETLTSDHYPCQSAMQSAQDKAYDSGIRLRISDAVLRMALVATARVSSPGL
jgi:hypothetical protein